METRPWEEVDKKGRPFPRFYVGEMVQIYSIVTEAPLHVLSRRWTGLHWEYRLTFGFRVSEKELRKAENG